MKAIVVLSALAYTAQAGSGSDPTPAPTPDPVGTPYNPSDKVFTGELGSHLASTLMNIKQLLTDGRMSSINEELEDYVIKNTECDPKLGILWVAKGGESPKEPMGLYFNKAGQVAGLRIKIYGEKAAQGRAVSQGYWIPDGKNTWYMSISFRPAEEMCTTSVSKHAIGDRIVINQDTIAKSIPMTLAQAQEVGFMPGSCMKSMGQHWFYDLQDAPGNSWISGNLLPVTPMYHPQTNNLNAFFWSSPLPQGPNNAGASALLTPIIFDQNSFLFVATHCVHQARALHSHGTTYLESSGVHSLPSQCARTSSRSTARLG